MIRIDLTGHVFGRLTVVSFSHKDKSGHSCWHCKCECGKEIIVSFGQLKQGITRSCGCLRREMASINNSKHGDSHGGKQSRLYRIWMGMRSRCNNPHSKDFYLYGKRGIAVCESWDAYENFRDWALSKGYNNKLSIDRVDSNLGYSPDNCRWVNNLIQANNKRNNLLITAFGETRTISDWGRVLGIRATTIRLRFHKGYSPEEALSVVNRKTGELIKLV
jgi:hypothetical protein